MPKAKQFRCICCEETFEGIVDEADDLIYSTDGEVVGDVSRLTRKVEYYCASCMGG